MGLEPQVQKATVVNPQGGVPFPAATVENIVATLKGTGSGKALLLVGHYDSVPTGPGASDDGSAVAAMLETLRALSSGSLLRNDVTFLFTDGEEVGLLGAKAFLDENPAAKNIGLVLNFEARGNGGPAIMFETSRDNGWLIREFAMSAPYPIANSLSYEIYKRIPNDTDLTMFKREGRLAGLNFAFISGPNHYHNQTDSIENIDERSLQHQGAYCLALARHLGDLELENTSEGDAVYFNVPGSILLHYPEKLVIPLSAIVALLFVAIIVYGLKARQLTLSGILLSFLALLSCMVSAAVVVTFLWWAINKLSTGHGLPLQGGPYNSDLYLIGFVALTISITSALFILYRKKLSVKNLTAGSLLWWAVLTIVVSLFIPGGSYLFMWPLLFSLSALIILFVLKDQEAASWKHYALLAIGAIPGILLFTPMIYLIFLAMNLSMAYAMAIMVVLLMGLLIPHLQLIVTAKKWLLPAVAALVSLGFIVAGNFTSSFNQNNPKPTSLFYAMNADTGRAVWASFDQSADEWTSQFLSQSGERGSLAEYIPSVFKGFLKSEAPPASFSGPNVVLLDDSTKDGARTVRLRINSTRQAPVLLFNIESNSEVIQATINGKSVSGNHGEWWGIRYYAVPQEGIEVALQVKSSVPLKVRAVDLSYGLPELPGTFYTSRPAYMISSLYPYSDSTLVSRTFTF